MDVNLLKRELKEILEVSLMRDKLIYRKKSLLNSVCHKHLYSARSKTPNDPYRDALLGWELMVAGSLPLTRINIGGL